MHWMSHWNYQIKVFVKFKCFRVGDFTSILDQNLFKMVQKKIRAKTEGLVWKINLMIIWFKKYWIKLWFKNDSYKISNSGSKFDKYKSKIVQNSQDIFIPVCFIARNHLKSYCHIESSYGLRFNDSLRSKVYSSKIHKTLPKKVWK